MSAVMHETIPQDGAKWHPYAVTGFVYCIVHHERKAVKIGFSKNPQKRFRQLQTACADTLTLFDKIPGDRALEAGFHRIFAERRLKGEWFADGDWVVRGLFGNMAYNARAAA